MDRIVSAEFPFSNEEPLAYETLVTYMIHGPCGVENPKAPCMRSKFGQEPKCSKHFPKSFQNFTYIKEDGIHCIEDEILDIFRSINYTIYFSYIYIYIYIYNILYFIVYIRKQYVYLYFLFLKIGIRFVDNSWVVSHNNFLCAKYDAHINVEICSTIRAVKYLYKYVYKGNDKIIIKVNLHSNTNVDEIETYLNCRYVSSTEASWRLLSVKIYKEKPTVEPLEFQLPNQQTIYFNETGDLKEIAHNIKLSKLHAWFQLNSIDAAARNLTYPQLIEFYRWDPHSHVWKRRENKLTFPTIGRLTQAFPKDRERFYLRILLQHVRGPTCFEDVRKVNGQAYNTFADAARARGLAENDSEWDDCLNDACHSKMPPQLRS